MMLTPWVLGDKPPTVSTDVMGEEVEELTETAMDGLLANGRAVQAELCKVPLDERLDVLHELGQAWKTRTLTGELKEVRSLLLSSTGYSEANIDLEMSLVPQALDRDALAENIDLSLPGGRESTERFVPLGTRGEVRHLPVGPVLILSSGNSLVPAVIPTAISLALGNCTVVKPSIANFDALVQVFEPLRTMAYRSPAANLMAQALVVAYFAHDSPRLLHLLEQGDVGAVNFWGGEPGRTEVMGRATTNRNHPRCFSNGPLTGFAIISPEGGDDSAARGLAENMVLYEQQLCSSPTMGAFIGVTSEALEFARSVADHLRDLGARNPVASSVDRGFLTSSALRVMELCGSHIVRSRDRDDPWAIAISDRVSRLDEAMASIPLFGPHVRRRFIELVVVRDVPSAVNVLTSLPAMNAYDGVDKVQTVGLALTERQSAEARTALLSSGAYRIVPLVDMYRRDPAEPYDGSPLAAQFSYAMYHRPGRS